MQGDALRCDQQTDHIDKMLLGEKPRLRRIAIPTTHWEGVNLNGPGSQSGRVQHIWKVYWFRERGKTNLMDAAPSRHL